MKTYLAKLKSFVLFSVVIIGCSLKSNDNDQKTTISSQVILQIKESCISDLSIIDKYLVVVENCEESLYHVYDSKGFDKLGQFGRLGKGPNEFAFPKFTSQFEWNEDSLFAWVQDLNHLYKLNLTNSLFSEEILISERLAHSFNLVNEINLLSDSILVGNDNELDAPFFVYNHRSASTFVSDPLFEISNSPTLPLQKRRVLFNNIVRVKPDRSRFVLAMDLFKRIDVFDSDLNHLYIVDYKLPYQDISNTERRMNDNTIRYYVDLDLTDNFIYALNWEMTFRDYLDQNDISTTLEVYNWDGGLVIRYNFGERIVAVAIDEKNNQIIGLNDAVENNQFRSFTMSHLK